MEVYRFFWGAKKKIFAGSEKVMGIYFTGSPVCQKKEKKKKEGQKKKVSLMAYQIVSKRFC